MADPKEPQDVYKALVADLSHTTVPTGIMGITLVSVGLFAHVATGSKAMLVFTMLGGGASVAKLYLIRSDPLGRSHDQGFELARRQESAHFIVTTLVALSVGALASLLLLNDDVSMHLLGTGLLFGYCSGVVCRIAIRPRIANTALTLAAVPVIAAAAAWHDAAHVFIACIFTVFLVGGYESVRHVYTTAIRHITTKLEMASLAHNDYLTGLANRVGLELAFRRAVLSERYVALHCLDLDGFKSVNDRHGHGIGDQVLVEVADRINACLPRGAIAARIGGDEFVVLQTSIDFAEQAAVAAAAIVDSLCTPFSLGGLRIELGVSLGYTTAFSHEVELVELLRAADMAAYEVKRQGGSAVLQHRLAQSAEGKQTL